MNILKKIKVFCFVTLRISKYKLLSDCKQVIGKTKCYHPLLTTGEGKIYFGKNVQIGVISSQYYYSNYTYLEARYPSSEIVIGNDVVINNKFTAVAFSKITIEDKVLIGLNCSIMDNDGHDLHPDKRTSNDVVSSEIYIGENVFISDNVTILKGVRIGKNSVIGNGSIVTRSIPDNVIAAGVPARIIKSIL
ncbi:acyltransferase [Flavobacterium aciduliphilum]|uniref:Maltose O-acetyltransferase n=1 Tax=Flavobacterium aciduliphilum TaxID=1101402 RepID=A0A328YZ31_9FLAO|nr:acyltransferase [Flavobacterium aciduliphilum]RAR75326.1 maltose O-acetyltransferase [Flavobacterium aciduliphilum]